MAPLATLLAAVSLAPQRVGLPLADAPSPTPTPIDPDLVSPGVGGFVAVFAIAVVVVLLVIDMTRRIRRLRYREEIGARLDAEQAAAGDDEP